MSPDVLTQSFENRSIIRQECESHFPKLGKYELCFVWVFIILSRILCCLFRISLHVGILIQVLLLGDLPEGVAEFPFLEALGLG